jgi:predicted membrane-bound dolichyl-phosphate-mannose-protein mannosyltransferase
MVLFFIGYLITCPLQILIETNIHTCEQTDEIDRNWGNVQTEILNLAQYRLESTRDKWYRDICTEYMSKFTCFSPKIYTDINKLPQGILGEVFFLNACQQKGIDCIPCFGNEDEIGADFKITHNSETCFFDVSINTSKESIMKKTKEGSFPTLFIPWKRTYIDDENPYMTYAERYMRYGIFDSTSFFENVISSNYEVFDCLRRKILKKEKKSIKIFNNENIDLSGSGIKYVLNLKDLLILIKNGLN